MLRDPSRFEAWVSGRRVFLTHMELALLVCLVRGRGRTLSRDELVTAVWEADAAGVGDRALDNLVGKLRRKLGDPDLVLTVRGTGFRLTDG